jgi:hypothetical protein
MAQLDPVIFRELPVIQKIIQDETWYESERRGVPVTSDDPVVREHVCEIILRIGRELRDSLMAEIEAHPGPAMLPLTGTGPDHGEAA